MAHPRCNAFGGGAISFALPTVQFPGFFRVPTVRQGLVPFMEPNVVVAQQQPVAPLVVAQGGGSSLEQQLLLAQLLALQQAQQKKNSGAEAAPAQTEKGAVDAETLKTIERLENMVEQLESQLQQSQQRPDQQGQLRALPMTAPVSHIQPAVLLTPANMTRLPASY
ncbi:MAG: hypothetical protein KDA41_15950 [Planctomycetales bacterium]|nr:hypothetical protein [Planctomycetales bacterium]